MQQKGDRPKTAGNARSTGLRPPCLARYSAASAAAGRFNTSPTSSGQDAIPHDAVSGWSEPLQVSGFSAIDRRIRSAASSPSRRPARGSQTANSSPPIPATRSPSRTAASSRRATGLFLGSRRGDGDAERDRAGDCGLMGKRDPAEPLVGCTGDRNDTRLIGRDRQGNSAMRELRRELYSRARRALECDRAGGEPGHASGDDTRARSSALLFTESHAGDETTERRGELIDGRVVE